MTTATDVVPAISFFTAEAPRGRVTITLGRSGQVVKRSGAASDVDLFDSHPVAGSKRSVRDRLGGNVDCFFVESAKQKKVDERQTIEGLLHSLGLGKYAIYFKDEEVDMPALRQMRENDLKELGIPMGPRKKILLALLPRSKRKWPMNPISSGGKVSKLEYCPS
ncbi:Sterile alpha motif domain-containing protein, putative isoform 2 [Hibiscus syriacus]|uniref:Sterile alpha motif domain-containing protein, putative isoform 2 n=1 Tax=Hibiscus syriacus TaxID=106335 RepID=A0A6A2ZLN5_HIBSY|nr:Sterile alpha motif domain-containing protein, putative isoform 2 [Hibiscus syriacus]